MLQLSQNAHISCALNCIVPSADAIIALQGVVSRLVQRLFWGIPASGRGRHQSSPMRRPPRYTQQVCRACLPIVGGFPRAMGPPAQLQGKRNMSRSSRRILSAVLFAAPFLGAGAFCSSALASDPVLPGPESLTLSPSVQAVETQEAAAGQAASQDPATAREPVYLDAAAPEAPNIHGFFDSPFKTSYTTPRGLVVFDHGVVWQPIVGLVFPLAFDLGPIKKPAVVAGIWNSVAMSQADPGVGGWEEMDVFVDVGGTVLDKVKVDLTFDDWNFPTSVAPPNKPKAEKNIELKGVYDDSDIWGKDSGFSVNPYVNGFFAVAGSSTVVLGRQEAPATPNWA